MTPKLNRSIGTLLSLAAMSCTLNAQALTTHWAAKLPIFDAHLHYNLEAFGEGAANAPYPMDAVFELFRKNKVTAIIANSRLNSGSVALWARQKSVDQGVTVVPFIRLYRDRGDYQTWHNNPDIWAMVQTEYAQGFFAG